MSQGKIKTLYSDKQKTEPLYPKTKLNAISDENGVGLEAIMESLVYTDELSQDASVPLTDADSLGGRPASEYATEQYVRQKIAETQLGGEVDLSDYALKTDVTKEIEKIDFPVDSVNGKTGEVTLTPDDIGARPNTWLPTPAEIGAVSGTNFRNSDVEALNSKYFSVAPKSSKKFRISSNGLLFGRHSSTVYSTVMLYAFGAYHEYRQPGVSQVATTGEVTVSTGGNNTDGWYIEVTNSNSGQTLVLFWVGSCIPTFI